MDAVADPALADWLTEVRRAPDAPPSLAEIRRLRAPRRREAGPDLAEVRDIFIPALPDAGSITDHVPLRARLYRPGPKRCR